MIEAVVLALTVLAARVLAAPLLRRLPSPAWWTRLRARRRPGIPVLTLVGAPGCMLVLWLIGEQRGVAGGILLLLWIVIPLAAFEIMRSWMRK